LKGIEIVIDLRSDTVTKPTPAMRRAMAEAEVGDDVYGEDPTVNQLEALAAYMLGKEAAVFVPSGTMGNLIATLTHCGRGHEAILGDQSHMVWYEQGGIAQLGGVIPRTVPNLPDGTLDLAAVQDAIRGDDEHYPVTRMIAVENTHNRCGGRALPVAYMDTVGDLAHAHGLAFHVDGARLWNAAVALGVTPARLIAAADSVSCCLSKGLAAPVGSVLAGSADFVRRARRNRKVVGGGMRQAGVLAAAGIVALTEMVERLSHDHAHARLLARGLAEIPGLAADPAAVDSNMIVVTVTDEKADADQVAARLAGQGVLVNSLDARRIRIVTNYHVTASDVEHVIEAFAAVLRGDAVAPAQGYISG
jgi:threonine aldolase